jgi:adenylosuccinate synthase
MANVGAEKGVTTGRARRCGWFDAALLKRSAQVNGLSGLCITKLDVLDGLDHIELCTHYLVDGEVVDLLPLGADEIARCVPVFETIKGWSKPTAGVTVWEELPAEAQHYLQRIEEVTGVPVHMVSTSPDRRDTMVLKQPLLAD